MWTTNETHWFVAQAPIAVEQEKFTISLEPATLYTLTTVTTGSKGHHAHKETTTPFPLPHVDSFQSYAAGRSPLYFTDWDGSFTIGLNSKSENAQGHIATFEPAKVLRQRTLQRPIKW